MTHRTVIVAWITAAMSVVGFQGAFAVDKPIQELPGDMADVMTLWTEPIKSVAEETRRFDPISGLWFGLLKGTVKSFERTAALLLNDRESANSNRDTGKLFRYRF